MIEILVILIFFFVFFRKMRPRLPIRKGISWLFRRRDFAGTTSIIGIIFRGSFKIIWWILKGVWWIVRQVFIVLIRGVVIALDHLK